MIHLSKWNSRLAGWLILSALVVFFYVIVFRYAVNIPFLDEYGDVLNWSFHFEKQDSLADKWRMIIRQSNEHRLIVFRMVNIFFTSFFGWVDLSLYNKIASFLMIPLFYLLSLLLGEKKNDPWYLLPMALLLFVPQHGIHDWAIVGYTIIVVYILAAFSFMNITRPAPIYLLLASLSAFIATFSFGNGMFVFFSGWLVMVLSKKKSVLSYFLWGAIMIGSILYFFDGYNFKPGEGRLSYVLTHPLDAIQFFLVFCGSIFYPVVGYRMWAIVILGLASIIYLGYLLIAKWQFVKEKKVALGLILFFLLTAGAGMVSRVKEFDVWGANAPRYFLNYGVYYAMLYVLSLKAFGDLSKKVLAVIIILSAILFGFRFDSSVEMMQFHKKRLEAGMIDYHLGVNVTENIDFYDVVEKRKPPLDSCIAAGLYHIPALEELWNAPLPVQMEAAKNARQQIMFNIDVFEEDENFLNIQGWTFPLQGKKSSRKAVMLFKTATQIFAYPVEVLKRPDVKKHFKEIHPDVSETTGISLRVFKQFDQLPRGNWQIGVGFVSNGELKDEVYAEKFFEKN